METGKVVAFFEQKKIFCAVCLEVKENKYHLLSEENREVTLGANRIAHVSSNYLKASLPRDTLVEQLKIIVERQKALMASLAIKELWELVNDEGRGFRLGELTELVFNPPCSGDQEMALFRALADDRLYFKQKGELYEAREPEKVEQILLQYEREAELERENQEASTWLAGVWAGEMNSPPANKAAIVGLLKEMALFGPEAPEFTKGKTLLQKAGISSPGAPFELLVKMKEWEEDENLFLHRYQISKGFPKNVLEEAEEILSQAAKGFLPHPQDRDLTFLHPLTIDSEYTRDIDDALSLEQVGGDYQVGIHITDVATFLNGHREIFQEAMSRAISIYLPDQRIPMIPPALSESTCSLIVGEQRRALSFLVQIDEEGKVQDYQILSSIIQVEQRLSYDSADQLLEEEEEELIILQRITKKLFQRRMGSGAFFIPRPERVIRVNREKEISIYRRDRESPSQKIVSELMILANYLGALFLKEKGIPAIYRSQAEPRDKIPPIDKFDPLQAYRLRRIMNRVEVSTRPLRHAGLGAEAYLTLTSPIRRFYDLLIEQQILGVLRGGLVLSGEQLGEIITQVGPAISKVGLVEELTEQYWILRYLEKRIGSTTTAVVLDRFPTRYLVHLNEYLLEIDMAATSGLDFVPGDQILVRVEKAHARSGVLKIAPA
ncbi:MAG: ribonuclease catalytic domain-containing protein [Deltaproteobacteria bacterium]|nr:ribonuclease catalytic domain-containing protein [Deltaproteobacteria bacterium]